MKFDPAQLNALSAAVEHGTLEAAARALHVTPSAVSQRIRALEVATKRILLVRSRPVSATPDGTVLLRLARQVDALTADAARELGVDSSVALPLAVNADSLATWVLPALAPLSADIAFELYREDQSNTVNYLRDGTVMAAVTSDSAAVQGCTVTRLGFMRYRPCAAPLAAQQWFPDGVTAEALAVAPFVDFDRSDDLQRRYLARRAPGASPPRHQVPGSADFVEAVRLGLGWGMIPDLQSVTLGDALVLIDPSTVIDVPLYWQQWGIRTPSLDATARAVAAAARENLR